MKKYIGNILDINGGVVRMLNTKGILIPHCNGGINTNEDDLNFISYDETKVNKDFLEKNNLRFLTKNEVATFMRGENLKGEKLKKPEAPKLTDEQKKEYRKMILEALHDLKAQGKDTRFLENALANC